MFKADCYNVMIVSPGDVIAEREVIKSVLIEWNLIHAESRGIILQPLGWDLNSYPELGAHPQEVLNRQLLERADIVVGVFWTRIGTETNTHQSGTIEEISRHVNAQKPALLYFSATPVELGSVDIEQYQKLTEYKKSVKGKGLYSEYSGLPEFQKQFASHLPLLINDKIGIKGGDESGVFQNRNEDFLSKILKTLSAKAVRIIWEMSQDDSGRLLASRVVNGLHIASNNKAFMIPYNQPRETAQMMEAIQTLEKNNLIEPLTDQRQVYTLTASGYRMAEIINPAMFPETWN